MGRLVCYTPFKGEDENPEDDGKQSFPAFFVALC